LDFILLPDQDIPHRSDKQQAKQYPERWVDEIIDKGRGITKKDRHFRQASVGLAKRKKKTKKKQ